MFAQVLSIRAAREDKTVAAFAELCFCPGGCCSKGQWEGDSLWSQEWLCLDKAKGRCWQDSRGPGSKAARPGPQHPLCSLWFSCFLANCLAWMSLSIRQSCGLYGCWTGLPVSSERSSCWCWRLEEGEDVLAYCGNLCSGHYSSGPMEVRRSSCLFLLLFLYLNILSLLKLSIGACMCVSMHVCLYKCVHDTKSYGETLSQKSKKKKVLMNMYICVYIC